MAQQGNSLDLNSNGSGVLLSNVSLPVNDKTTWRHDPNNDEHIYLAVARPESAQARFGRGTMADVVDLGHAKGTNRLLKTDKHGEPSLVELEGNRCTIGVLPPAQIMA